jgi:RimJ/RimL family protein N-acetyltransferase
VKLLHRQLETERLLLRRFRLEDSGALYEYLSDEEVVRFEPYKPIAESEAAKEASYRAENEDFWAVCLREDGRLIGNLYFHREEPAEWDTWELGFVFNRHYWGRGYATEAARRMLAYGFEEQGAHRIMANCSPQNTASWRLLERLGMRREGHFRQKVFFFRDEEGQPLWLDTYEYAILRVDTVAKGHNE